MRLALFEPDIPQNTGALMRLCACLGVPLDVIGPCGFVWDDAKIRRVGMDYIDHLPLTRHTSWRTYQEVPRRGRLVALTTHAAQNLYTFSFRKEDTLLMGRESAGLPPEVHATADARLVLPLQPGLRSLNVATAAAMALGEALRQIRGDHPP